MVAKIISGKSIKGVLHYNEKKVGEGKADQLLAQGFPSENLSFKQKVGLFEDLTTQNRRCKTNAVHISLNFDPSELLDSNLMRQIALTYMDKIGFGSQPFLLYRHKDAAHEHVHIVTTNIKDGGERIPLHNIGQDISEPARKEIEEIFGLVKAEGRNQEKELFLNPVAPEVVEYGKSQTKASISNDVRFVVANYKISSLSELNAVLGQFNIVADRGTEGTKMYEKGGLVYSILGKNKEKKGVPIKASSIYTDPTLARLQPLFAKNKLAKKQFAEPLKGIIKDTLLHDSVQCSISFAAVLAKEDIRVLYRQNAEGRTYGITFIDNKEMTVFNGSDLGKSFSAAGILQQIENKGNPRWSSRYNQSYLKKVLGEIDYGKKFPYVLSEIYRKGLRIEVSNLSEGKLYRLGHRHSCISEYVAADKKLAAYFEVNGMSASLANSLLRESSRSNVGSSTNKTISTYSPGLFVSSLSGPAYNLQNFIENFLKKPPAQDNPPPLDPKRKKKRRKPI